MLIRITNKFLIKLHAEGKTYFKRDFYREIYKKDTSFKKFYKKYKPEDHEKQAITSSLLENKVVRLKNKGHQCFLLPCPNRANDESSCLEPA